MTESDILRTLATLDLHHHGINFTLLEPELISDNLTHYAVKQSNLQALPAILWESKGLALPAPIYAKFPARLSSYGRHTRKLTKSGLYAYAVSE